MACASSAPSSDSDSEGDADPLPAKQHAADGGRTKMTIQLRDKSGAVFRCTTWADEPLQALMTHYCRKQGVRVGSGDLRLMLDGERIALSSTPNEYDLEDNDIIDVAGNGVKK